MFHFKAATVSFAGSTARWLGILGVCAAVSACDGGSSPPGTTIGGGGDGNTAGTSATGGTTGTGGAGVGGSRPNIGGSSGNGGDGFLPPEGGSGGGVICRLVEDCEATECGPIADGCGGFIECGGCDAPATCGGAGVASHCGIPGTGPGVCTPATCESLSLECGQHGDGCGGVISCPVCDGVGEECVQGVCEQTASCDPLTCADYPEAGRCGLVSDGCSGTLDCDFAQCPSGQRCGAEQPGYCGVVTCTPDECEEALVGKPTGYCGFVSNGCDGPLDGCAAVCGAGEACGGLVDGVYTEVCVPTGSSGGCTPTEQATACAGKCGEVSDDCTSTYQCGGCGANEVCGANDTPNVCGAAVCVPTTCQIQDAECGEIEDGCGGHLNCGSCSGGETCAGAGVPYECGAPTCQPQSQQEACQAAHANCGSQSNGCDGTVSCGTCTSPETCGGGGTPNQCGSSCVLQTCQSIGATCGPQGDGCGGQIDCGSCAQGFLCQGTPSTCIDNSACTNLCEDQATCTAGSETTVTGTVYAPNGTEPLYNALVYVPNIANIANLPAITAGPTCERCEDEDLGEPLVAAITGPDGQFTLKNVPAGVEFPLVVKMGKWRRVTMIPAVAACSTAALSSDDARLPRHMNDAEPGLEQHVNIPKFALTTGRVDAIECVMRKIGIADSEFTAPSGSGRIHLYRGQGSGNNPRPGAGTSRVNGNVTGTSDSTLFNGTNLNAYDVAIFDCEGKEIGISDNLVSRNQTRATKLQNFANTGGRIFASHYAYTYLHQTTTTFNATATWGTSSDQATESEVHNPTTGIIDSSHSKGQAFNSWLGDVNALHPTFGDGYIGIIDPRGYVRAVNSTTTERFVTTDAAHVVPGFSAGGTPDGDINVDSSVQQYSFNTPVGTPADQACGRVLYSAFHVAGTGLDTSNKVFPEHCDDDPLTPQEKILEFMIFDLSACVSTTVPPSCVAKTCQELGANCGYVSDGCGGLLNCGTCESPESCGGGGTPNVCGSSCTLRTCASAGATCGTIGDGCGGTLQCGTCPSGSVCGGGGTPNVCGTPACTPRSCQQAAATCGDIGDGCGGTLHCGTCPSGQVCGGGGPNTCGTTTCTPTGCGTANCGSVGDGCGNAINCGTCPDGSACGAGGPNQCGAVCTPRTCQQAGKNCGAIGDGCGGVLDCGICSEGTVCGGGGTPNVCGGSCTPVSCQSAGAACGTISDGCGGVLSCGTCPAGQVCGANGQANQCGQGSCTPDSCGVGECGTVSDGCSSTLDCGPCNGCVPFTCTAFIDCGPVADGCGGLVDCGVCTNGNTCGGGGFASKCGGGIQ